MKISINNVEHIQKLYFINFFFLNLFLKLDSFQHNLGRFNHRPLVTQLYSEPIYKKACYELKKAYEHFHLNS